MSAAAKDAIENVTAEAAQPLVTAGQVRVLDVRNPDEDRYRTLERRGDEVAARARRWLASRPRSGSEPFFAWVHLFDPHDPYDPPADLRQRFASAPYDGEIAAVDRAVGTLVAGRGLRHGAWDRLASAGRPRLKRQHDRHHQDQSLHWHSSAHR